jgi:hypothetical protein
MSELYEALKNRPSDTNQQDIDAIAAGLRTMTQHLDKLHPELKGIFGKIVQSVGVHLDRLRDARFNAYESFLGKGPIARKLREHIALQSFFAPQTTARGRDLERWVDDVFNKYPTKDEAELKELKAFVEMAAPLMTGQQLPGQEFTELLADAKITDQKSGFYVIKGAVLDRHVMVLTVSTLSAMDGIKACYVLERGHDEYLLFYHQEEQEWFKADYSFSFQHLTKMLRRELDEILKPLNLSAQPVDLPLELAKITAKVDSIFDQLGDQRAPTPRSIDKLMHEKDQSGITLIVSPNYLWSFTDTRGAYPSRVYKFYQSVGGGVQSAEPTVFNEFSRQVMVRFLNTELDRIADALKAPEPVTQE